MLARLIYVSEARRDLTRADLNNILRAAQRRNTHHHITGILTYNQNAFMQCLEGEKDAIEIIYGNILADDRHRNVKTIFYKNVEDRFFPNWSMAHINLNHAEVQKILERHRLNIKHLPHGIDASQILDLMIDFSRFLTNDAVLNPS